MATADSTLYFRQLLSGRDFAHSDPIAAQMVNFVYAIGDRESSECILVDPAYAPDELVNLLAEDGMTVTGVLATHYHPDHVGGDLFGNEIGGIAELLSIIDVPIHLQRTESEWVTKSTGVDASHFVLHDPGDTVSVGDIGIDLIHTPGHTPGSQCFLVDGSLVAGDTLFLDGCGRTDLPGSDPSEMVNSLRRLAAIDDSVVLYPGHRYSPASSAPLGEVKATNWVFQSI